MPGILSKLNGNAQRGFSLVELMVGVLIGLIGMVVIFQMLSVWDARKRTTTAGGDAQISGSVALYYLERDVKLAGFGFGRAAAPGHPNFLGCNVQFYDSTLTAPANAYTVPLLPVRIVRIGAVGANPVQLYTLRGASATFAAEQTFSASTATTKTVQSNGGMIIGDLLVVAEDDTKSWTGAPYCAAVEFTDNTNGTGKYVGNFVGHTQGTYINAAGVSGTSQFNAASGPPNLPNPAGFTAGWIFDLGPRNDVRWNLWQLRGTALTVADLLHPADANGDGVNDWEEVADNIIDFQAQYGFDINPTDNMIDPNPAAGEWTSTEPSPVNWTKLRAIRVGLLARSQQYEKDQNVTTSAPGWSGGTFVMKNVDGTADTSPGDANDWRRYRYRVYEMVIPLRNLLWGQ